MRQKTTPTGRSANSKPTRPRRTTIHAVEVPILIRTELRTGSGTRTLSVRRDTELRHVKSYPDGRREMMPRAYTSAVLFGASVMPVSRRNNSRSIFARTETAYRRIEERMAGTRRIVRNEGSEVQA